MCAASVSWEAVDEAASAPWDRTDGEETEWEPPEALATRDSIRENMGRGSACSEGTPSPLNPDRQKPQGRPYFLAAFFAAVFFTAFFAAGFAAAFFAAGFAAAFFAAGFAAAFFTTFFAAAFFTVFFAAGLAAAFFTAFFTAFFAVLLVVAFFTVFFAAGALAAFFAAIVSHPFLLKYGLRYHSI